MVLVFELLGQNLYKYLKTSPLSKNGTISPFGRE
jgi:hypothetical protein